MIEKPIKKLIPHSVWKLLAKAKHRNRPAHEAPIFSDSFVNAGSILSCLVAYNEYGGYCIPRSSIHRPAVQAILAGEVWERSTINFVKSNLGCGDIVHAGTYFGDFLPALSAACSSRAKIWAFEPNPENFQCAEITILLNQLGNVELINAGLGAEQSIGHMIIRDGEGRGMGGASKFVTDIATYDRGRIQSTEILSIDEIVPKERDVSIIQLDVEGYEKEALEGAIATIKRCHPILVLETLPEDKWFQNSIMGLGYRVSHKMDANSVLIFSE